MSRRFVLVTLALALLAGASCANALGAARFYTPAYGGPPGQPEKVGGFDLSGDGSLTPVPGSPFPAADPGAGGLLGLAFTPDGTRAISGLLFTGGVQAYRVPSSGVFETAGATPTASVTGIAIGPDGRFAFASTREFGSPAEGVRRFAIGADGSLASLGSPAGSGQYGDVAVTPDGHFLYASTGSAIDRFALGADGSLSPLGTTPLPGAYLLAASADGRFIFVFGGSESGVATLAIGADGGLSQVGSTAYVGITSAKMFTVAPDGRHVFVPDYNHNQIAEVAIAADGSPAVVPGGMAVQSPEAVGVSPDGRHLVFYRGGGSENAIGVAALAADGSLTKLPFETPWTTGEPEPLVFQPHPTPVAQFGVQPAAPGAAVRFDAAPSTRAFRFDWDFGDGTKLADGGARPNHVYAKPGLYPVTVTVTDDSGCSATHVYDGHSTVCPGGSSAIATATVDTLPALGKVKATPKKFRPKPKGKAKGRFGTTFRYSVSEAGNVRFKFERKKIGRRVAGKCKPASAKNKAKKKCPLFKPLGSRAQAAKAGANKLKWNGNLKGKPLPPGSYRATVVATDKAGGRSAPKKVGFRILPLSQ